MRVNRILKECNASITAVIYIIHRGAVRKEHLRQNIVVKSMMYLQYAKGVLSHLHVTH